MEGCLIFILTVDNFATVCYEKQGGQSIFPYVNEDDELDGIDTYYFGHALNPTKRNFSEQTATPIAQTIASIVALLASHLQSLCHPQKYNQDLTIY